MSSFAEFDAAPRSAGELERIRHEVLAGVLARKDTDWGRYGLSESDRRAWTDLGVPSDHANWASILRDLDSASSLSVEPGTPVQYAGRRVPVLELIEQGLPGARIARLLARTYRVDDWTPWPVRNVLDPRRVEIPDVARDVVPVDGASPRDVVALLERLLQLASAEADPLRPYELIRRQANAYLDNDRRSLGKLLGVCARSYGVVDVGAEMDLIAACWARPDSQMATISRTSQVFEALASDRHMYLIDGHLRRRDPAPLTGEHDLPSPSGLAWATAVDELGVRADQILAWHSTSNVLNVVQAPLGSVQNRMDAPLSKRATGFRCASLRYSDQTAESVGSSGFVALESLAGLTAIVRGGSGEAPRDALGRGSSGGDSVRSRDRRDDVVVRYTGYSSSRAAPDSLRSALGASNVSWVVRGHWRNQWYPSRGVHEPIWIAEHPSGRGEGPPTRRDIVTKVITP